MIKSQALRMSGPEWTFLGATFDQISYDGASLCGVLKRQIACALIMNTTTSPEWRQVDNDTVYVSVAGEFVWAIGNSGNLFVSQWTKSPAAWTKQTNGLTSHVASNGETLCQEDANAAFAYATTDIKSDNLKFKPVPEDPMLLLDLRMGQNDIYALNASGFILHRKLSTITTSSWILVDGPLRRVALDRSGRYLCGVMIDLRVVCAMEGVNADAPEWRLLEGISAIDLDVSNDNVVVLTPERQLYRTTIDLAVAPPFNLTEPIKSSSMSSSSHGWEIAAIVMVVVLVAVMLGALSLFYVRRRLMKRDFTEKEDESERVMTVVASRRLAASMHSPQIQPELLEHLAKEPDIRAVRLDCMDLMLQEKLSAGAFGEVWKGEYAGSQVAVKTLHFGKQNQREHVLHFAEEIKVMATLQHPRIVHFHGVCWSSCIPLSAVMEFMDSGDVRSLLDHDPEKIDWSPGSQTKLGIAIAVAEALVYLHKERYPPVIHRDVKSRNVLLDLTNGAKLGDFGCSKAVLFDATMTADVGTAFWAAPEVLRGERYSELADIYSLGVLLWELAVGAIPYKNAVGSNDEPLVPMAIVHGIAMGSICLTFRDDSLPEITYPESIAELAMRCLRYEPSERPTADDALSMLKLV